MNILDKIYLSLPIPIQQLIVAIYGLVWFERRFSAHFHQQVRELVEHESWSKLQFAQFQESQLTKLVRSAWNSHYYRDLFTHAGLTPDQINLNNLSQIQTLSKEIVRTKYKDLLTRRHLPPGTIIQKSSGTTGTPTNIYYSREFHAFEMAVSEARNLNWAGVNYKNRRVMFGVRKVCDFEQKKPPFWRFSPVENMAYASIYHLSPKYLPYYMKFLRSYQPSIIMGYPSALFTIAEYALENDDFPAPATAIITMAETLELRARDIIEKVWKSRIYDRYGAVEGCVFVSQCEYGKYHVSPEVGIVEIIDRKGKPCPPGVLGKVICTGLQNTLQPLIRYEIGDVACWAKIQECDCKRQMPILERIEGRFEDMCFTADGREILRFDTVFKGVDSIKEAQIVQNNLELFTIYVVPTASFSQNDIELIMNNMKLHVGDIQTKIEKVDAIERNESGKFKAVISLVDKKYLYK